jgi:hypothetical protein
LDVAEAVVSVAVHQEVDLAAEAVASVVDLVEEDSLVEALVEAGNYLLEPFYKTINGTIK